MDTIAIDVSISPNGKLVVEHEANGTESAGALERRISASFHTHYAEGLLHLATAELQTALPASFAYVREFAREYLTQLCHIPADEVVTTPLMPPAHEALAFMAMQAPPMRGLEYLNADVLEQWWQALDDHVRQAISTYPGGASAYLRDRNPLWRLVGRVTFHLAENKQDESYPFAFMASYTERLSRQGRPQHLPLGRALQQYAGAKNRAGLVALLTPVHQAAERLDWVKTLVENGGIYEPLAWTPAHAHALLSSVPALEDSGLVVRVPDWWKRKAATRPRVDVRIGNKTQSKLGFDALLDFEVGVALGEHRLSAKELRELLASGDGLVQFRGQWIELDREKLQRALDHWKQVEREAEDGISFIEGMRLLAGTQIGNTDAAAVPSEAREWAGISAGAWLHQTLAELSAPDADPDVAPAGLNATLREYQSAGVRWMSFVTRLGLGACLADDMGLGKTIQMIAMLLKMRDERPADRQRERCPSLLVLPTSLIANWQSEAARFAPTLRLFVAHPAETNSDLGSAASLDKLLKSVDLVITTYGMLTRLPTLRERNWNVVILDEAQAIKNAGSRQTRAAKELKASARIALTGTPIENRLSDLWSLFDFLNPGLLGDQKKFGEFMKSIQSQQPPDYSPLRRLVAPYILRRLKTDKRIIADLPDKIELKTYCNLTPEQARLYEQSVQELESRIKAADGIQRRGIILAFLLRFKQICNHPSHWVGNNDYLPEHSGKFQRLGALCEELAERQEKVLIFTQFREITQPLADYLGALFKAPGLVLHGGTTIARRREMVQSFQQEGGPPFFVLSLKAGGTGLNLTEACHVVHFDRWWNPAVENQATDRAFRIGQKRNVMVHKFVTRGTVEEKIDALISEKTALSNQLLDGGGAEKMLTEMSDGELLKFVSLDINRALEK